MEKLRKTKKKNLTDLVDTQFIPWKYEERARNINRSIGHAFFEIRAGCSGEFAKTQSRILKEQPKKIKEYFTPKFIAKLEELRQAVKKNPKIDLMQQLCIHQENQFPLHLTPLLNPERTKTLGYVTNIPYLNHGSSTKKLITNGQEGKESFVWICHGHDSTWFQVPHPNYSEEDRATVASTQAISQYSGRQSETYNKEWHKTFEKYMSSKKLKIHSKEWEDASKKHDKALKAMKLDERYKRFLSEEADITKFFAFVDILPRIKGNLPNQEIRFKGRVISSSKLNGRGFVSQDYLVYVPCSLPYNAQGSGAHFQIDLDRMFNVQGLNEFTYMETKNTKKKD